ncbi:hypothetical protein F511_20221 [Dorcoceras hygrometricum]|uniref:Uncharacterized protein n=1 Tax=Dorcoceras hygrometricum TaxID=472368 RepID=A0A2Z7AQ95_9LAMI|nr:hypothetical protein F511_20221 [Dorcoceras hygrometricum]
MVSEHGPEINTRTLCWSRFYRPSLRGTDSKEKLRDFVDGLKPALRHDVGLVEPKDYRGSADKALRADQDWKAVVEERQLKRQAFQQKDQRPPKKPYKNQQRSQEQKPQEQKPLVVQPISAVSAVGNRPQCPKCQKNHPGIQLAVGPQPLWLRNHNFGLAQRIMVKRLETSPHDPLGIADSSCKNQLDIHACKRAVNPRQRSIDSYMHRISPNPAA